MAKKDIRNSPGEEEELDPFLMAETLLLGGDFSAAASLASEYSEARFYSLRGILAWLDEEEEGRALELYEEGLKRLRKEEGARKVTFNTFSGLFHPLLLLAREQHKKAAAVLSTGIEKSRFASVYSAPEGEATGCFPSILPTCAKTPPGRNGSQYSSPLRSTGPIPNALGSTGHAF